jgi:hypothetical protein
MSDNSNLFKKTNFCVRQFPIFLVASVRGSTYRHILLDFFGRLYRDHPVYD